MRAERAARLFVASLLTGIALILLAMRWIAPDSAGGQSIDMRARLAERGGWSPAELRASVGEPIRLRLTSDDVMHGFALGQSDNPAVDVKPGEFTEISLTFDQPGKYVFYCTRWCGVNHWRMRGTIEVDGIVEASTSRPPLFVTLGIDIDAPHPASAIPSRKPSAARGADLPIEIPERYKDRDYYRSHSPAEIWDLLRGEAATHWLSDDEIWDTVARMWQANTSESALLEGERLYADNCAACHGERGGGDGVMAEQLAASHIKNEHGATGPTDFTDPRWLLGASPAILYGKILRGGMGTGMPYWGPIFSEDQIWSLVDYLWTFQFELEKDQ